MAELGQVYGRPGKTARFVKRNISVLSNLENAYISSRYLPVTFVKPEIEALKTFAQGLRAFLKTLR